jgi:CBS domain-containing protein
MVNDLFVHRRRRAVPVSQDGRIIGILTLTDVKGLSQDKWVNTPVEAIMTREPLYSVAPEDDLASATRIMTEHDLNQLLVFSQGKLVGLLSRADIVRHVQLGQELGLKPRRDKS